MVELREFIKESLSQIVYGVIDAQTAIARDTNGVIVPKDAYIGSELSKAGVISNDQLAQFVEFDVAITVSESVESKGKVWISAVDGRRPGS